MLAVRTEGNPLSFANAIRNQVMAIDTDQPIASVRTMDDVVDASEGQRRSVMILLGTFASTSLLLTIIGMTA